MYGGLFDAFKINELLLQLAGDNSPHTLKMADVQFSEEAMSLTLNYPEVVQTVRRPRRNENSGS